MFPNHNNFTQNPSIGTHLPAKWLNDNMVNLQVPLSTENSQNSNSAQPSQWHNDGTNNVRISQTENRSPMQQFKYSNDEIRWPSEFGYQFPLYQPQVPPSAYSSTSFPSTSSATYKVENGYCYQNSIMVPSYHGTPNEYMSAMSQSIPTQWKVGLV